MAADRRLHSYGGGQIAFLSTAILSVCCPYRKGLVHIGCCFLQSTATQREKQKAVLRAPKTCSSLRVVKLLFDVLKVIPPQATAQPAPQAPAVYPTQPAPAYSYAPQPNYQYNNPDEVRTVFVTGFPPDVKERELNNLMRFIPGYEVSDAACLLNSLSAEHIGTCFS